MEEEKRREEKKREENHMNREIDWKIQEAGKC